MSIANGPIGRAISGIIRQLTRHEKALEETKRLTVNAPFMAGRASLQTIAAGVISVTRPHVVVLPESGTADNLDEIENFSDGKFIVISTADVGDTITVRDESISGGNIALRGVTSRVLSDPEDSLLLIYKESVGFWIQAGGTPAGGVPALHASTHRHGGTDEVATVTPAANAIPKAGGSGTLALGWIPAGGTPGAHAASHQDGGSDELLHQTLDGAGTNTHAQIDTHISNISNPHSVTKAQVGLGNVTNDAQIPLTQKGAASGVAELDASSRLPIAQLPVSVMEYKGTWDASTNTPTLADGTGSAGDVYRVSVAGTQDLGSGAIAFAVGDYVIYNGATWEKSDTTDAVASVNGATGVVVLTTTNISEGTNLYYTNERSQDMISSFLVSGNGIGFSYDDVLNTLTILLATLTSDWDIGEDRAIQAELLKARDAEGLQIQDDGANGYIHLIDGGETKMRRDSAGVLLNLGDLAITELGTLLQTGFIRTSSDNDINFTIVRTLPTVGLMGAGVNGDTFRRFLMFADGKLEWGDGASARDTNLYRSLADTLRTDDNLIVVGKFGAGIAPAVTQIHTAVSDAVTNAITNAITMGHLSSGTPAAGFGIGFIAQLESSTTNHQDAGRLTWEWTTATHASRASKGKLSAYLIGVEVIGLTWDSAGLVQVPGTLNAVGAVDFDSTLNVDGAATFNAATTVKPGTASDTAKVGGVLLPSTTTGGNVGTGEDDLGVCSVLANTLAVNLQSIWFEASGSFANNANAKTLRVRFGAAGTNLILAVTLDASSAGFWVIRGRVIRTGAATQKGYADCLVTNTGTLAPRGGSGVATGLDQTLSGAVSLRITGEAVSNNDIVLETFVVGWDGDNT